MARSHDYNDSPHLTLEQGWFASGFAGGDRGLVVDLGDVPLATAERADLQTDAWARDAVTFLCGLQPERMQDGIRKMRDADDQEASERGYLRAVAKTDHTYLLRCVAHRYRSPPSVCSPSCSGRSRSPSARRPQGTGRYVFERTLGLPESDSGRRPVSEGPAYKGLLQPTGSINNSIPGKHCPIVNLIVELYSGETFVSVKALVSNSRFEGTGHFIFDEMRLSIPGARIRTHNYQPDGQTYQVYAWEREGFDSIALVRSLGGGPHNRLRENGSFLWNAGMFADFGAPSARVDHAADNLSAKAGDPAWRPSCSGSPCFPHHRLRARADDVTKPTKAATAQPSAMKEPARYAGAVTSFEDYERQGFTWERAMAQAKRLAQQAAEIAARDPDVRLVAVICTPDAAEVRDVLPRLLASGEVKPGEWVPLLMVREEALRVLRANTPAALEWLATEDVQEEGQRRLPVVVVTALGVRVGHETYTPTRARPLRIPCSVHAMIVCREAFQQAGTGKWCVIGTHDRLRAAQLPCLHSFAVFLSLGDFASGSRLEIRVRHGDHELAKAEMEAGLFMQVGQLDIGLAFPPMTLASTGVYAVELLGNGSVLARREIFVEEQAR